MTVLQALNDHTRTMQLELPVRGKLLFMLEARQSMGNKKYGHSIDRDDLTREEWLQHLLEEMLDGAIRNAGERYRTCQSPLRGCLPHPKEVR